MLDPGHLGTRLKNIVNTAVASSVTDTFMLLRNIQLEILTSVGLNLDDECFVEVARKAFENPELLYHAFCNDDGDALSRILQWATIPEAVCQSAESISHDLKMSLPLIDTALSDYPITNAPSLQKQQDSKTQKVTHTSKLSGDLQEDLLDPHVMQELIQEPEPIPEASSCLKLQKQQKHIKRLLANQLRDSFF